MIWYFVESYNDFCDLCTRTNLNKFDFHITEDLFGWYNTKCIHYKEHIIVSIHHVRW